MSEHNTPADDRAAALRELESEFGELFSLVRRLYLAGAQRLSPGLSPGAFKLFSVIARRGEVTASDLVERTLSDKSQVSRIVRELEDHGLVQRTPDPRDGRSSLLSPTADGLARLLVVREHSDERLIGSLEQWDIADIRQLTSLLHALSQGEAPR